MSATDPYSKEGLRAEYDRACAERDELQAKAAPLRKAADAAANEAETYRVKAMEAKAAYWAALGGRERWFALKQRIGAIAKLLGGN